jgi:hypothetical protein
MKIVTQSRYATVASTAALVVALGGTSYAAVMITGHDIKNGTVTTQDVKNHDLRLKDLATGARAHLKGAPGSQGPAGPQGSQGPVGPSNAYSVYNDLPTTLGSVKTLLTLSIPPGSYVVNAKAMLSGTGAISQCTLVAPGGLDYDYAQTSSTESYATVANQLVLTTTSPTDITLQCLGGGYLQYKRLTAIKVDSVSNTQGPNVS